MLQWSPPSYVQLLPLSALLPCIGLFVYASSFAFVDISEGFKAVSQHTGRPASKTLDSDKHAPVLRVTIAFLSLYYSFLYFQAWANVYAYNALKSESKARKSGRGNGRTAGILHLVNY